MRGPAAAARCVWVGAAKWLSSSLALGDGNRGWDWPGSPSPLPDAAAFFTLWGAFYMGVWDAGLEDVIEGRN